MNKLIKLIYFWILGLIFLIDLFTISILETLFYLIFYGFINLGKKMHQAAKEKRKYKKLNSPYINLWVWLLKK